MHLKEIWLQGKEFKTADSCRYQLLLLQVMYKAKSTLQ